MLLACKTAKIMHPDLILLAMLRSMSYDSLRFCYSDDASMVMHAPDELGSNCVRITHDALDNIVTFFLLRLVCVVLMTYFDFYF
jgi:hypothetical protein